MFIPKGDTSVGVSPFSIQRVVNDVAATYFNRYSNFNNLEERLEEIYTDFENYYDYKTDLTPNDSELMNLLYASTALQIDRDVVDDFGNAKKSTREETINNVKVALAGMGIKIEDDVMEDMEDEAGGHHRWDQSANQMGMESLSLGLKNIILRVGRKEEFGTDEQGNPKILTFAPDVSHIYSGLVRYSSKALTTQERWKRMVEYSTIAGNNSSKLLIQDYYLNDFTTKATYNGQSFKTIAEWVNVIGGSNFDMSLLSINDSILAQEFITLLKGLELVSRDMKTTELFLAEEYTGFKMFDTNSNGIKNRLTRTYGDAINMWTSKLQANPKLYEQFESTQKGASVKNILISILQESNIFLSPKVKEEILQNKEFGVGTNLQKIKSILDEAVESGKPLIEKGETQGPLNSLVEAVIDLQVEWDEGILENSFTNLEGKTIYGFQRQTPIILTLRNLGNPEFLAKFKDGSPYVDQNNIFTENGFKNNPIVEAFQKLGTKEQKELSKTFSLDGVYSKNDSGFREDVSFSDMTDRHFAAVSINMMLKATNEMSKKTDKGFWTAVTLGHNEASSLIDYNYVPILDSDGIKNSLSTLISQEKARIELIESKVNEFIFNTNHPIENGAVTITYEQLKEYFKPLGIPVYKGMLDGKYVMTEPITDENGELIYSGIDLTKQTTKQLDVSKNLQDLLTYEELISGQVTIDGVLQNLNKVLDAQIATLEEMKVIELLDRTIVDVNNLSEKQKGQNSAAIQAFGISDDWRKNLKVLLTQFWLGSTFSNQILVGDPRISFKNDFKDILKRHRSFNAALLGVDVPFSAPSLGIYPKSEVKMLITTSDESKVYNTGIDKDDAQSYSSLDFWLYKQFTKGRLTQNSYNTWLRIQAGETLTHSEISDSNAYLASDKTISAQGNQIVKHSEHYILPTAVAFVDKGSLEEAKAQGYFIDVDGKLKAKVGATVKDIFVGYQIEDKVVINKLDFFEHRSKQVEKYLVLQGWSKTPEGYKFNGGIDIKTVTTASKGAQKNVIDRNKLLEEYSTNPSYYTQSLAANTYGDQVENPQGKDTVIDASQNQEIKTNEIENAKELVEKYFDNQSARNNFEIELVLKELYGKNYNDTNAKLEAKQFLEAISRVMKDSGTDNQKLDFLTFKQIGDEFISNYNLNLPPVRQKFTQALFKMFSKALKHKVAGNSMVQVSSSDYNLIKRAKVVKDVTVTLPDGSKAKRDIVTWDVVSPEEFRADNNKTSLGDLSKLNYNGKNQVEQKEDELIKAIQEAGEGNVYFFDEVRFMKPYINASNELEYFVSESIMPPWFDENIPEALRHQYGVRIPSQDKQSSVAIEWVSSFDAALGNSIVVPKEIIYLSGSGFDYNLLFVQRAEGYWENGRFFSYENNFEDFKHYMFNRRKRFKFLFEKDTSQIGKELILSEEYKKQLILKKYEFPITQENYNISYPAAINNDQLRISIKLLSTPEIIFGAETSIYETPVGLEPYKKIFENYKIEIPKGTIRERELSKRDYFSEENVRTISYYPFRKRNGQGIFFEDTKNLQVFSLLNYSRYQHEIKTSKLSIKIISNSNVLGIFAKRMNINLRIPIKFEGSEFKEFTFKTKKNRRVFGIISSTLTLTTNESKESLLSNHDICPNDLKVISVLVLHGFDLEDAFAFTKSKGAKIYNQILSSSKNEVSDSNKNDIIREFLKDTEIPNYEMSRVEFQGISELAPEVLEKKYFKIYHNILGMYLELSKLLPAAKLKIGLPTNVRNFQRAHKFVNDVYADALTYYSFSRKSKDFENAYDIYNKVNYVARETLLEMQPIFQKIYGILHTSISFKLKDFNKNIWKCVDEFLFGEYSRHLGLNEVLFENHKTFTKELLQKRNRLFNLSNYETENKSVRDSLNYLNRIIQVKDGAIVLNFEGKLSQSTKDMISDSWLLLRHSPIPLVKEIANDLFKYYFLEDAFQNKLASLEILFPSSKFKGISEVYDEILKSPANINLEEKFFLYFATTQTYFKNYKTIFEVFNVKNIEDLNKVASVKHDNINNPKIITSIKLVNCKIAKKIIQIDESVN